MTPVVLSVAGSDPCGGAGIQMDLAVFARCGVYGTSVVTALTAQNTGGIRRVLAVPPRFVASQIDALAADLPPAAVKCGMLHREQIVSVVAGRVRRRELPNLVIDPVLAAKDGTPLLSPRGVARLKQELFPLALLVTPNLPEAAALTGLPVATPEERRRAAEALAAMGPRGVLIKGGHAQGAPVDYLLWADEWHELPGERVEGPPMRGTGCALSAAITAHIALGLEVPAACRLAKEVVAAMIAASLPRGRGATRLP